MLLIETGDTGEKPVLEENTILIGARRSGRRSGKLKLGYLYLWRVIVDTSDVQFETRVRSMLKGEVLS